MNLLIYKTQEELQQDLVDYIVAIANKAIEEQGYFNFVLTGGNSPKELYHSLATTYKDKIDWTKVYFFFGDERNVMPDHESYNGLMAKRAMLDLLEIPANQIFYVDTTLAPEKAAIEYTKAINAHFDGADLCFDLILLGMGDDAHTASLFPGTTILNNKEVEVDSVFVEKLSTYRISFTAPLINKAKNIAFLVFGENKAEAVKHVIEDQKKNPKLYPTQLIKPVDGSVTWFLDDAAAALLDH
ncbi:6-phosphogluconolactonase [Pedobacter sp. N36a]|uniref:6-phosphogluconolactonase n=1 Tax=unclassified Pedobacter TaxID=2628915 RepID=UPI0007063188|nr:MULTISPECIES: 6-phosphogluconolactonase [unclassified Pedobacter]ALL07415.1 6-phosphogluconolactonase [Pedobacter sp. PACM 27299]MBC8984422.1 6-phosphogluconolactonase [Pedobacter sp. N36a]